MQSLIFTIAIEVLCLVSAVMGFTGIWVPNRFGVGALWITVAMLIFIWGWNTYLDTK